MTDRLSSDDGRIRDPEKLQELMQPLNDVYQIRRLSFHWGLTPSVQITGAKRDLTVEVPNHDQVGDDEEAITDATGRSVSMYKPRKIMIMTSGLFSLLDHLMIMTTCHSGSIVLWMCTRVSTVNKLTVHSYEIHSWRNQSTGKYRSLRIRNENERKLWFDRIDVDSVLHSRKDLTTSNRLPVLVLRYLREKQT